MEVKTKKGSPRLFIDKEFIEWLSKQENFKLYIKFLSFLHLKSIDYKLNHNLIFDECFVDACKIKRKGKKLSGALLLGFLKPKQIPSPLKNHDYPSSIIRFCIDLASKRPYKVFILTNKDKKEEYLKNKHYNDEGVKEAIEIFAEEESIMKIFKEIMKAQT